MRPIRIIPLTIAALLVALPLRIVTLVSDSQTILTGKTPSITLASAIAEESEEATEEHAGEDEEAHDEEMNAEDIPAPAEELSADEAPANISNCSFSEIEIDLLQSLSKRREAIEDREKKLQLKENMLQATEMKINEKIDEMRTLKKTLNDLLALYDDKEQQKIRSLVKIYENMKPKDAARIFEEMDMGILLQVVDKMSERKIAPILANLTPTKAQAVTAELANQKKIPSIEEALPPEL